MQIVILAGGLATRLRPVTECIPKSMVAVAGRPFLEWQLDLLHQNKVRDVVLCVGHLAHLIQSHFQDGSRWGVRVRYSSEGELLLGTGGALKNAEALLAEKFLVMYGDSYLLYDYAAVFEAAADSDALMVVYRNEGRYDLSNIVLEGNRVARYEKGINAPEFNYIDAGLSVLSRQTLALLTPGRHSALDRDLFAPLVSQGRLTAYLTEQRFYEIGSHSGLADLDSLLARSAGDCSLTPKIDPR